MLVEGERLHLNADVAPGGELRVEVIDPVVHYRVDREDGESWGYMANAETHPCPGFSISDSEVVRGDSLQHQVFWRGGSIGALAGRPIRLRFEMRRATLYAFRIG
ncbi:MAG: hypothetical protein CMJ18_25935 [Phycisphaeraceae bacterium]|nr:hypothetical protein [Phycisphaeraceae bacterium]